MPKVKTRHWADVTLSVKNMFGIVPASRYGWPKNVLHWAGIHESILDICATVRPHFVIADAIAAMEGDGPLNGTPKWLNKILLADDPAAVVQSVEVLIGRSRVREFRIFGEMQVISDSKKPPGELGFTPLWWTPDSRKILISHGQAS